MLVADISMRNVLDVLKQDIKDPKTNKTLGAFWETKTTTASRLQGRIKTILDFAIVNEYRQGPNPGLWSGYLDTQLATPAKIKKLSTTQQFHILKLEILWCSFERTKVLAPRPFNF